MTSNEREKRVKIGGYIFRAIRKEKLLEIIEWISPFDHELIL